MNTSPSQQVQEGALLCVVHFLKPVSDESRTVVLPVASLKPIEVEQYAGSFRFCFAEFPQSLYEKHGEDTPFLERVSQSGMFYFEGSPKSVDQYADDPNVTRATVDRLRTFQCYYCIKILTPGGHYRFPFFDTDHVMHTIRTIRFGMVAELKPREKALASS